MEGSRAISHKNRLTGTVPAPAFKAWHLPLLSAVLIGSLVLISGCGGVAVKPGGNLKSLKPVGASKTALKPGLKKRILAANNAGLPGKGFEFALAQEIVDAAKNPFWNKLRPVSDLVEDDSLVAGGNEGVNPLEGISLVGIVYRPDMPMALLNYAVDESTHFVKRGDTFSVPGGELRIAKINRDAIEIEQVGLAGSVKSLALPDILDSDKKTTNVNNTSDPNAILDANNPGGNTNNPGGLNLEEL